MMTDRCHTGTTEQNIQRWHACAVLPGPGDRYSGNMRGSQNDAILISL